jgi:hypothetical protein
MVEVKVGVPKQKDITTSSTAGEITTVIFNKPVYSIIVENKSTTDTLYVSFDMGETWIDIATEDTFEDEPFTTKGKPIVLLKSDGTSQSARIIYRFVEG